MSTNSNPPITTGQWYRLGIADLIFILLVLMAFRVASNNFLDDPGTGWHIRNIDAMLAQGSWMTTDSFTYSREQPPPRWFANQWLGELPAWIGWKVAGLEGITVMYILIIALLGRWMYLALVADGLPWPMAVLWTVLGLVGTACSWLARPNLFTILYVFLTSRALVGLHEGSISRSRTLWLIPMFTLWANTHGGFVAGLTMIVFALGIECVCLLGPNRSDALRRLNFLALLFTGCVLATLINPYGYHLYPWVFSLLGDPFFMDLHQEWLTPNFHGKGSIRFELLMLLFPAVLACSTRRPNYLELGLSIMWLHFALNGFRYVPLWVVVAVPLMARSSMSIPLLNDLAATLQLSTDEGRLFHTPKTKPSWLGSAVIVVLMFGMAWAFPGRIAAHKQDVMPSQTLDKLIAYAKEWKGEHGQTPIIFHSYGWGGYITWHGWPELVNWIDDRNEVQGKARIQEYFDIMKAKQGWEEKLNKVTFVCVEPETPLDEQLRRMTGSWKRIDGDQYAIIYLKLK